MSLSDKVITKSKLRNSALDQMLFCSVNIQENDKMEEESDQEQCSLYLVKGSNRVQIHKDGLFDIEKTPQNQYPIPNEELQQQPGISDIQKELTKAFQSRTQLLNTQEIKDFKRQKLKTKGCECNIF